MSEAKRGDILTQPLEESEDEVPQKAKKNYVFAGDRGCRSDARIRKVINKLKKDRARLITGDSIGVDKIVQKVGSELGFEVVRVKPTSKSQIDRTRSNLEMIKKYKPRKVYLFHNCILNSTVTKDMRDLCDERTVEYEVLKTQ